MTEKVFQWNPNGPNTQEFSLGVVDNTNKQRMEETVYKVENMTPGVPYAIHANVLNIRTNQYVTFDEISDSVWIESNIDQITFTKDHSRQFNITATNDNNQVVVRITHTLTHPDLLSLFETYHFKFDLFFETESDRQCFQTYETRIEDTDEYFPIPDLISGNEYNVYYSLLVKPGNDTWYYVDVHQHVGQVVV